MNTPDDDLRQLFEEATAGIRPQGTLDDIRSRSEKVDPMTRRWFLPSLVAATVMALVIGGAFWLNRGTDDPPVIPASHPTSTDAPTDGPTTGTAANLAVVDAFYVGDGARGPRIFTETHTVDLGEHTAPVTAVNEAMTGTPLDLDYRTYWPAGVEIDQLSVSHDVDGNAPDVLSIRIAESSLSSPASLAERPAGVTAAEAARQVQAIVRTAQKAMNTDAPVEFWAGDVGLSRVLGVEGPTFSPGNDDNVMALVQITEAVTTVQVTKHGGEFTMAPGRLSVSGVASAFEGNIGWEILVGGDAAVDSGFTTAAECCTLAPYTFKSNIVLEPGQYTLVVHDNDDSGEGRPLNRDTKEIIVE